MEKSSLENNYLLTEPVGKLLAKFAVPCVVSLIISCLYNIVDQIFVGHGIGYLGNAATGIIFPITVIGWGVSLLFGDGAAAFLSLSQGRGDTKGASRAMANSVLFSFVAGVIIIIVFYLGGNNILYAFGATDASIGLTRDYGYIIFMMMPLALAQNTLAAIIRADGNPRYAMLTMLVGAIINIIMDPITIFVWDWGIQGAAFATIWGQFVSFILCLIYLRRSRSFHIKPAHFVPHLQTLKQIIPLGGSSLLTQLSIVIVTVVNNNLLVYYGAQSAYGADIPLAAFVVIMKLFQIVISVAIGIAVGAQPIVGYNYGAQRYDRVKAVFKKVILWTLIASAIATILFQLVPQAFIQLFGSDGQLYATFATMCLRIYLALIILTCVQKACAIFLQSMGRSGVAIPLSMLRDVACLITFSCILPAIFGVTGIFWAAPLADIIAFTVTALVMVRIWKQMSVWEKASGNLLPQPERVPLS